MKLSISPKAKTAITLIGLLIITIGLQAQKLPHIQTVSVPTPATVKIDGKATEWNNEFQAYNKTTDIYYTLANDANNLYLVVKATDATVIRKILSNSFTIIIGNALSDGKPLSVSLPLFSQMDAGAIASTLYKARNTNTTETDSLILRMNQQLEKTKEIKTTGIKQITDPFISVYNEYGIKGKGLFDSNKALTYELALPIKYINVPGNKLNYTIRLNGLDDSDKNVTVQQSPDGQATIRTNIVTGTMSVRRNSPEMLVETTTTDFSGEYTLAK